MASDKELADKVVVLGIGYSEPHNVITDANDYWLHRSEEQQKLRRMSAYGFVRDPRVAMALMEKMSWRELLRMLISTLSTIQLEEKCSPRVITEACAEALS